MCDGIGKHAVRRYDDVTFEIGKTIAVYSETVVTTELTGRVLTVGSLTSLSSSWSYSGERRDRQLGAHRHHLVAAGLQALQQLGQGFRGVLLEVVHQDDALALRVELLHDGLDHLLGLARP